MRAKKLTRKQKIFIADHPRGKLLNLHNWLCKMETADGIVIVNKVTGTERTLMK